MMPCVIGIDASLTGTGVAVIAGGKNIESHCRIESKYTGVKRLVDIEARLKHILDAAILVDLVLLEGYAYAAQNQAHQIGELGGVIRRMLHNRTQRWIEVSPSQVKKFATGKGNAKKDLIIMQVYKRWGVEFSTSDEADAFVLAKIGQALMEKWDQKYDDEPLVTFQWEVIAELRKKYKEVLN